jgi:hypothetical protein
MPIIPMPIPVSVHASSAPFPTWFVIVAAVFLVVWLYNLRHIADVMASPFEPDVTLVVLALLLGVLAAAIWPLSIFAALVCRWYFRGKCGAAGDG